MSTVLFRTLQVFLLKISSEKQSFGVPLAIFSSVLVNTYSKSYPTAIEKTLFKNVVQFA